MKILPLLKRFKKITVGLYKDLHKYFIILPPGLMVLQDSNEAWYLRDNIIMHALGAINGEFYTNSKEALEYYIAKGKTLFECDVTLTQDGIPVLTHNAIQTDLAGFKTTLGKFTVLTLNDLVEYIQKNKNLYFILDIKDNYYREICSYLVNTTSKDILKHFIIQAGTVTTVKTIRKIFDFQIHWNFSVDGNLNRLLAFVIKNNIHTCSVAYKSIKNNKTLKYINKYNLKTFAYTVNNTELATQLINKGCYGIMSDELLKLERDYHV